MLSDIKKIIMAVILSLTVSGCATIVSGTTQKINVTSQPSGADAKLDNNLTAKTPTVFTMDRKNDHSIEIKKDGYKTTTVLVRKAFNEMAAGNILIGGIIGAGVDAASGSTNKLIPERVDVILEEGSGESLVPKFAVQKDQDFYETNVLKKQKSNQLTTVSSSDKDSSGSRSFDSRKDSHMGNGSVVTQTNFNKK